MNLRFILLLHSTLVTVVQIKYALLPSLHHHHLKSANPRLPSSSLSNRGVAASAPLDSCLNVVNLGGTEIQDRRGRLREPEFQTTTTALNTFSE